MQSLKDKKSSFSGWRFFLYSLLLGLGYLLSFPKKIFLKEALQRILIPINVSRCYEFSKVIDLLQPQKEDLVFDLSSPKLFSHYLRENAKCQVVVSDISFDEVSDWVILTGYKKVKPDWLLVDGRQIGFRDNTFDKVFSISVLEHISGRGDAETLKELGRILKPAGKCILTLPYAISYRTEFSKRDAYKLYEARQGLFHWSHFYTEEVIREKLIRDSGLKLEDIYFGYGIGSMLWKKIERLRRFGFLFWPFSMPIAQYGLSEYKRQPPPKNDDYCLAVVVVLTKREI